MRKPFLVLAATVLLLPGCGGTPGSGGSSDSGYVIMGDVWYAAIQSYLPATQ